MPNDASMVQNSIALSVFIFMQEVAERAAKINVLIRASIAVRFFCSEEIKAGKLFFYIFSTLNRGM